MEDKTDLIEAIGRGLAKAFSGDHTYNIDRILRSPGRKNSKYSDNRFCRILSSDGPEYAFEDLQVFAEEGTSSKTHKINLDDIPDDLPQKFNELLAKNRVVQATWKGERRELNDQSGSGYDMAMASILAGFEFSAEDIAKVDDLLNFKGRIEREDWVGQAKLLADTSD